MSLSLSWSQPVVTEGGKKTLGEKFCLLFFSSTFLLSNPFFCHSFNGISSQVSVQKPRNLRPNRFGRRQYKNNLVAKKEEKGFLQYPFVYLVQKYDTTNTTKSEKEVFSVFYILYKYSPFPSGQFTRCFSREPKWVRVIRMVDRYTARKNAEINDYFNMQKK